MSECPCLPPDYAHPHDETDHAYDCGGQTWDPPCGGCLQCTVAQILYYAREES